MAVRSNAMQVAWAEGHDSGRCEYKYIDDAVLVVQRGANKKCTAAFYCTCSGALALVSMGMGRSIGDEASDGTTSVSHAARSNPLKNDPVVFTGVRGCPKQQQAR